MSRLFQLSNFVLTVFSLSHVRPVPQILYHLYDFFFFLSVHSHSALPLLVRLRQGLNPSGYKTMEPFLPRPGFVAPVQFFTFCSTSLQLYQDSHLDSCSKPCISTLHFSSLLPPFITPMPESYGVSPVASPCQLQNDTQQTI